MAAFLDNCKFNPTLGGTTDWTFSSASLGYQSPSAAGVGNGRLYKYFAISADQTQWELGQGAYNTGTGVLARTTILFSTNSNAKVTFSAAPTVAIVALKEDLIAGDESGLAYAMTNGTLVVTASAGALTVAVKTMAGNDPSALDPVWFYFRDSTSSAGDIVRVAATAALSVVLGSTKTLGAASASGLRVWIGAFNNAGTVQLGAMNCSDANGFFCPAEHLKYATVVPASSSRTWYSTSAISTAAPWRFIGFCEWNSLTTAGTWVVPDIVQLFGPGMKKPGELVQAQAITNSNAFNSASASFQTTNTTATIAPQSAANLVKFTWSGSCYNRSTVGESAYTTMFRGATQCPTAPVLESFANNVPVIAMMSGSGYDQPNTTSSVTYAVKLKGGTGVATMGFPNAAPDTISIIIEELMG